jgi:hypothetical protein
LFPSIDHSAEASIPDQEMLTPINTCFFVEPLVAETVAV